MLKTDDKQTRSDDSISKLNEQAVRGGTITLVSQGASVAFRMVSIAVLSRLLSPEDFGLVAMVMAFTAFAAIFRDLGLSSATIQESNLSSDQISTLHWINVSAGAVLTMFVALSSPLVAWVYGQAELAGMTLALSLSFVLESFGTQPNALLTREMRFGRQAIANLCGAGTNLLVAAPMAILGFSYWSLVAGTLLGVCTRSALFNLLSNWRPGLPVRGSGVRTMLHFGANVTAFNFVNYFSRNLDNVLIGSIWGAEALGLYSRAYQLLQLPITNLREPITRVAFPALSKLRDRPVAYREFYQRLVSVLAFFSMPLTVYLFVASDLVVEIVLGPQWVGVTPIFSVLAVVAFIQPCISTLGIVFLSLGRGGTHLRLGILASVVTVVGFLVGSVWGALGVAVSYAITTYAVVLPIAAFASRTLPVRISEFINGIRNPCIASIIAGLLTWLCRLPLSDLSLWTVFTLITPLYALLYLGSLALLPGGRNGLSQLSTTILGLRKSKGVAASPGTA